MSVNLVFGVKGTSECIDFPFQTDTNLTRAVIRELNAEKRMALIKEEIDGWVGWSKKEKADMYKKCEKLMKSPKLQLDFI